MIKQIINTLLIFTLFPVGTFAQLTPEAEAARNKGIVLYKQSDWYDSQPLLEIAATEGDRTAQYYLAEAIRLSKRYTTAVAKKWYEAAAEQGDLYAMLRLSSGGDLCRIIGTCGGESGEQWNEHALKAASERAKNDDPEAMRVLYILGKGLKWLEKAAETGDGRSQYSLALAYKNGQGWFLIPGNREKAVERWAKASAEAGYPPGMYFYADVMYKKNSGPNNEVAYWLKKSAEAGHLAVVVSYALNVAHLPDTYGYPLNLIEAYGLIYLVSQLTGGGAAPEDARRNLPDIAARMTPEEIQQGIAYAAEWERTHPPLSYYPPIYGY
ncbi:tetratricopeptide repeat protein [Pseudomonas abietaniphila]|uniref:tetratricopeptide repeat protein n=1 Tax=Pseudomonas abietaniphila TaxID=89065 RepID=UPI00078186BF|nr:tetratricopeptide repeat protein [Pseudomonas abietaniphila]